MHKAFQHAVRRWVRRPAVPATGLNVLALGIAAAATMFSVVDTVVLRASPWREPERLVVVHAVQPDDRWNPARTRTWNRAPISWASWRDLQQSPAFVDVGVWLRGQQVFGADRSAIVTVHYASSNLFKVLGVTPASGRFFGPEEDDDTSDSVVISHGAWQGRFGGRDDIVGATMSLAYGHDSAAVTKVIIGVLPPPFRWQGESPEFVLPLGLMAFNGSFESNRFLQAVARLGPNVSLEQAEAVAEPLVRRLEPHERRTARVVSLSDDEFGAIARPLWLLLAAAGLLLAIACANVAGLLLVDARARRLEFATRIALGATRRQLAGQLAAEALLLGVAASVAGVILAVWLTPVLASIAPPAIRAIGPIAVNLRVAAWCIGVGAVTVLCFGIGPVWSFVSAPARSTMAADVHAGRLGRIIVAGQLAFALVLTVCAGMFAETLLHVRSHPLGFEPDSLAIARVRLKSAPAIPKPPGLNTAASPRAATQSILNRGWIHSADVLRRLEALPGVVSAAGASVAPFTGTAPVALVREPGSASGDVLVQWRAVTEGYFQTMGIPIVAGRALAADDRGSGEPYEVVLSADAALRLNAHVTKDLAWGQSSPLKVVGVAGQVQHQASDRQIESPALYLINFRAEQIGCFLVRTSGDPRTLLSAIRRTIEADGSVIVVSAETMSTRVADSMADERFRAVLAMSFGAAALALAAAGLFGVMNQVVSGRRQEIAVRMALGADATRVRRLVLRDATIIVAGGIAVGAPAAAGAVLVLRALFAGGPSDPVIALISGAAGLAAAATAGVVLPVFRAGRIDPAHLLRD